MQHTQRRFVYFLCHLSPDFIRLCSVEMSFVPFELSLSCLCWTLLCLSSKAILLCRWYLAIGISHESFKFCTYTLVALDPLHGIVGRKMHLYISSFIHVFNDLDEYDDKKRVTPAVATTNAKNMHGKSAGIKLFRDARNISKLQNPLKWQQLHCKMHCFQSCMQLYVEHLFNRLLRLSLGRTCRVLYSFNNSIELNEVDVNIIPCSAQIKQYACKCSESLKWSWQCSLNLVTSSPFRCWCCLLCSAIRASFARRDAVFICHFIFLSLGDHRTVQIARLKLVSGFQVVAVYFCLFRT